MRLNKSTRDAIRILVDCARSGDSLIKVADLSTRLDITPQNVFKIVHLLSRAGMVAPTRGRYGGVRLARPAADIHIGDVVRALEMSAVSADTDGDQGAAALSHGESGVNRVLDAALEAFVMVLNQHSLADMAAGTMADASESDPRPRRPRRSHPVAAASPPRLSRAATPRSMPNVLNKHAA